MKTDARAPLLLAALLIAVAPTASGFVPIGQIWGGASPMTESFHFNNNLWPGSTGTPFQRASAFSGAMDTWNTQGGADFQWIDGGLTGSTSWADDGQNIGYYRTSSVSGAAVALAGIWFFGGEIFDCDIRFFQSNGFGTIDWSADPTGAGFGEIDLQLVATHELGHCLGLDHNGIPNTIMSEFVLDGTGPAERDLSADDIAGIQALYGLAGVNPDLSFDDVMIDDSAGDNDGNAEAGETVDLYIDVFNSGGSQASAVTATVTNSDGDITLLDNASAFGNVPASSIVTAGDPVRFTVAGSCSSSFSATFDVTFTDGSDVWNDSFNVPVTCVAAGSPNLVYDSAVIVDWAGPFSNGDNDGQIEAGETIAFNVWLDNIGSGAATNVSASVSTTSGDITFNDAFDAWTNVPVGVPTDGNNWVQFDVDPGCVGDKTVTFTISGSGDQGAFSDTFPVDIFCPSGAADLQYSGHTPDDSAGDGDGMLEAGETIALDVDVTNIGTANAFAVGGTLSTTHPLINITDGNANILVLPQAGTSAMPFEFEVDPSCTGSFFADFTLDLTESASGPWQETFSVAIDCGGPPAGTDLSHFSYVLWDNNSAVTSGDNDGIAERGETIALVLRTQNNGTVTATNVSAQVSSGGHPFVAMVDDVDTFPDVAPGGGVSKGDERVTFEVLNTCQTDATVTFTITYTDAVGTHVDTFDVDVVCPPESIPIVTGHTLVDITGDGDGRAEPGETVRLEVAVENFGTVTAANPTGTISGGSADMTLTDTAGAWPDIAPGATENSIDHFEFTVSPTCAANSQVILPIDIVVGLVNWTGNVIPVDLTCVIDDDGDGVSPPLDCDDTNDAIYGGAVEICDGLDNNCVGGIDEGGVCTADADNDGFDSSVDCDDSNASVNPGATEVCDGVDNDCDSTIDVGAADASTWFADGDLDGYGNAASSTVSCAQPPGHVLDDTDCDDVVPSVNPGGVEACDGLDNDCDGSVDVGAVDAVWYYPDLDADGFGDGGNGGQFCTQPSDHVADDTDCDDTSADAFPGGLEVCDGVDNDCNGELDESDPNGTTIWYEDEDNDGYGDPGDFVTACNAPSGYVEDNTDCRDNDFLTNPGAGELCDGVDNNCDGIEDSDDATDASTWYWDNDGDGFGSDSQTTTSCEQPSEWWVLDDTDCNDSNPSVNPESEEIWYDGRDQNCDGNDNDQDGDGFPVADDCDDTNPNAFPGGGGFDENCGTGEVEQAKQQTTAGGCACDSGSPAGGLGAIVFALLAGIRRR